MKYLLNASNLHAGGGIQVASSVISEIGAFLEPSDQLTILFSSEVKENISLNELKQNKQIKAELINTYGIGKSFFEIGRKMKEYNSECTIFGPLYTFNTKTVNIVGFAQAWIIYPNNECYSYMNLLSKIKTKVKYWIQAQFFKRSDFLIVELEHVKYGLIKELGIPEEKIHVIRNCISSLYLDKSRWNPLNIPNVECDLKIGYMGRNYTHKNTRIIPDVVKILRSEYQLNAKFYVTFTKEEWENCAEEFKDVCINVGELNIFQCPSFYKQLDAVFFPSLLECFSATPLEAMAMEVPLFASDRPFNRDICGAHAEYFDPLSPKSAADKIGRMFQSGGQPDFQKLRAARSHAIGFSNPKDRAKKILALLKNVT